MTEIFLTCDELDDMLSDYLEGTLAAERRVAIERHARDCSRCRALLGDLMAITREARALRPLIPSRDLWPEIAARIEAPVVPHPAGRPARRRVFPHGPAALAAAAAALVIATAGVTYLITSHQPPAEMQPVATRPVAAVPVDRLYDQEIARLSAIVRERRAELDPATAAVIERNLRVIDRAIAESRAALAKDPASSLLNDQLNVALDRKVELLRTVALLPTGT